MFWPIQVLAEVLTGIPAMDKDRNPVYLVRHPITSGRLAGVLGHTSSTWAAGPCPLPTEFSELSPELSVFTTPTHRAALEVQQLTLPMCVQLLSHILFLALFFSFLSFCFFFPPPRVRGGLSLEPRLPLNPWSSSCLRRLSVVGLQACATHSAAALLVSVFPVAACLPFLWRVLACASKAVVVHPMQTVGRGVLLDFTHCFF